MQSFLIIVLSISTHSLLLCYAIRNNFLALSLALALALALSLPPSPSSLTQARAGNDAAHLLLLAETGS
jgi:hypothetical protein